jgi:hypothetical protein
MLHSHAVVITMNTNEDRGISSKKSLLKNTENKMVRFLEKCLFIKSRRSIIQVENSIMDIMTPSGGKKMMVPGVPEAIFLKSVVLRDAMFDTPAEVIDGRG